MRVFEYGSGHSTLWWAKRVSHVNTVEHDPGWFEAMRPQLPANVDYRHRELEYGGDYAREILTVDSQIDVAVIDGRDRVNCARACLQRLDAEAVIVWDNTERSRYQEGFDLLSGAGYRKLDFHGYGPVNSSPWRTSVFYKPGNCLGI
jgi:predicted O-methyltransferase YrrM